MKKIFFLLLPLLLFPSCGGRLPSPNTSQSIISHYLKNYGKKYPTSILGTQKIEKVQVLEIEEVQKNLATLKAIVFLTQSTLKVQVNVIYKAPLGWRAQGWENLENQTP